MSASEVVLRFVGFLAVVRSMFRQTHLFAEKQRSLQSVSTSVEPFKVEDSAYADEGVTLTLALNANLRKPPSSERQAVGMTLLLRRREGRWIAEAEVGWTGRDVGWDPLASKEIECASPEDLMAKVPPLVTWMDATFRETVEKLPV